MKHEGGIPREEVEKLADKWMKNAELYVNSDVESERHMALQEYHCARKLRELIQDAE